MFTPFDRLYIEIGPYWVLFTLPFDSLVSCPSLFWVSSITCSILHLKHSKLMHSLFLLCNMHLEYFLLKLVHIDSFSCYFSASIHWVLPTSCLLFNLKHSKLIHSLFLLCTHHLKEFLLKLDQFCSYLRYHSIHLYIRTIQCFENRL